MINRKIYCGWGDDTKTAIKTSIKEEALQQLNYGEIVVENMYIPLHGSFWLASDPKGIHPRKSEFMSEGGFTFGNGGVGRVVSKSPELGGVDVGDIVAIFGHYPCKHYDCYACTVLHRYTECDYGESHIIGHGKNSYDGTFSDYTVLPSQTYEVIYKYNEEFSDKKLHPFMFSFLIADVRNALTRLPDVLKSQRMILIGCGYSGMIAAYLFSKSSPGSQIFAIDSSISRLDHFRNFISCNIETYLIPENIARQLDQDLPKIGFRREVSSIVKSIGEKVDSFFKGKNVSLLMDCSSANTAPIWDNATILSESSVVIPFGFGSDHILLNKELIQKSGLTILMSRGVGNIRNRKEVIELIKSDGSVLDKMLLEGSVEIQGLDSALKYILKSHKKEQGFISQAYIDLTKQHN